MSRSVESVVLYVCIVALKGYIVILQVYFVSFKTFCGGKLYTPIDSVGCLTVAGVLPMRIITPVEHLSTAVCSLSVNWYFS